MHDYTKLCRIERFILSKRIKEMERERWKDQRQSDVSIIGALTGIV